MCIYSTLKYIQDHTNSHHVTPIITFDQPLWWKALIIIVTEPVASDLRNVALRLGGFHTEMSFLGCIGHLMAKSGLQELLQLIYASNAVVHMLTGKTIVPVVRGHFIVDAALNALILASTFNVPIPASHEETEQLLEFTQAHEGSAGMTDLDEAALLYDKLIQGLGSADQVCQDNVMAKINDAFKTKRNF